MPRTFLAMTLLAICLWCTAAFAQFPPGGMNQGGPFMGPGGPPMGPGGSFMGRSRDSRRGGYSRDGSDRSRRSRRGRDGGRSSRFEGFLRSMDTNGDGIIQESEVPEQRRGMLRMISMRFGLDPSKGISLDQLRRNISGRRGDHSSGPGGDSNSQQTGSQSKSKQEEPPLVPGFGTEEQTDPVPGFGVRVKPSSRIVFGTEPKLDPQLQAMFDRADQDHNGKIDGNEYTFLPRNLRQFDLNRDRTITVAEVVNRLEQIKRDQQREDDPRMSREDEQDDEDLPTTNNNHGKSYRFRSPHERLPEGIPDWFVNRDTDFDGQVTMAEYSRYWTRSTINEYYRYDKNRDGIITPAESLAPTDNAPPSRTTPVSRSSDTKTPEPPAAESKPSTHWWMR